MERISKAARTERFVGHESGRFVKRNYAIVLETLGPCRCQGVRLQCVSDMNICLYLAKKSVEFCFLFGNILPNFIHCSKNAFTSASYSKSRTSGRVEINPEQKKKRQASILPPIIKAFGPTFLFGAILKLVQDVMTFISPQLLRAIINFVDDSSYAASINKQDGGNVTIISEPLQESGRDPMWRGILYAVLLFIVASTQTLFLGQYFQRMFLVGLRIRTALVGAIYKKALCLSNASRKESTVGEIVNLMAVDAQRFMDLTTYINMLWSAPLQIALALYFLWDLLGPSVLAGMSPELIL